MNESKNGTEQKHPVTRPDDPTTWVEVGQTVSQGLGNQMKIEKQFANGLTKREYFALEFMAAEIAKNDYPNVTLFDNMDLRLKEFHTGLASMALRAVTASDAFIKELNK